MGILIMPEDMEIRWYREHPIKDTTFVPRLDDPFRSIENFIRHVKVVE